MHPEDRIGCRIDGELCDLQRCLSPLALGDVTHEGAEVFFAAMGEVVGRNFDRERAPVFALVFGFEGVGFFLLDGLPNLAEAVHGHPHADVGDAHAEQFFTGVAERAAGLLVDV